MILNLCHHHNTYTMARAVPFSLEFGDMWWHVPNTVTST